MPEAEYHITSIPEKWRLECPREDIPLGESHTNWFPIDGVFRCRTCADDHDTSIDPEHEHLRDRKTGELVSRDEVVLAIEHEPASTGV